MPSLTDRANASLARILPGQKITLTTENGHRSINISPISRLFGTTATVLAGGWIVVSSAAFLLGGTGGGENANQVLQDAYELRLAELVAERDAFAQEAVNVRGRFENALAEVSQQQSNLLQATARTAELSQSIAVLRGMLSQALAEREQVGAELASLQDSLTPPDGGARYKSRTELDGAISNMTAVLEDTARERDSAVGEVGKLTAELAQVINQQKIDDQRRDRMLEQIEDAVAMSLTPLNKMFRQAGVDVDTILANVRSNYSGVGGPEGASYSSKSYGGVFEDDPRLGGVMEMLDKVQLLTIASQKVPLAMPVKSAFRYSSPFGNRKHPVTGRYTMHDGMDMAGARGTPIYATADGVVTTAGWQTGYGNVVKIRHAYGFETTYAHQSKIYVTKGQRVSLGDKIGAMGSTGRSTGTHLHYEVRLNGTPVNPMTYVKAGRNVY